MERNDLIPAKDYCTSYNIEYSFISWLYEHELLQVMVIEEEPYIPKYQLKELEHFTRLHHELEINLEGIEAISHLLHRVKNMQAEINQLKKKINIYESFFPASSL